MSDTAHAETVNEVYGNMSPAKPSIASTESVKQAVERPKLNLKPRSQPPEHLEGNAERERSVTDFWFLTDSPFLKISYGLHIKNVLWLRLQMQEYYFVREQEILA